MSSKKVAVVTAAGSGIGQAVAVALANANYRVTLAGRRVENLKETSNIIQANGVAEEDIYICPTDVSKVEACYHLISASNEHFGGIDLLANVAGYAIMQPIHEVDELTWRRTMHTNLSSVHLLTSSVWPIMAARGGGLIVNISSIAAIDPFEGLGVYAVAKVGVNMHTMVSAKEGAPVGIKTLSIGPGAVETDLLRSLVDEDFLPKEACLQPSDVANLLVEFASGQREFVSGEAWYIEKSRGVFQEDALNA